MNRFLMGMSLVGTASNSFAAAMADGKGTLGEMVEMSRDVASQAAQMTGAGSTVLVTVSPNATAQASDAADRVQRAVVHALEDGTVTVEDAIRLVSVVAGEVLDAAGLSDKVVVDARPDD